MYISYYKSPIGWIKIKATNEYIEAIEFTDKIAEVSFQNSITKACGNQLNEYFLKKREKFELPVKLTGTVFQEKVWKELCNIPYGEITTYKEIARKIGNEKAFRAVGTAIGKNPIAILVPYHRVIGADGSMTGYAYGIQKKEMLLKLENV